MKHFAIFLCMVIVFACVDLQRVEIGEDDSKADQDACKAASLDANQTITEDLAIRSKDIPASAQSSDETSKETEASEHLSSATKSMNVTSEVKKSEQRTQVGKRVTDLQILNNSHRNISANQHSIADIRSLSRMSAPQRDTSLISQMMFGWSYRTERRGALAQWRNVTNVTIEGLEDFDTYVVISLMVKGYVEAPVKIETRLIQRYQEQYCDDAQRLLQDGASGYWNEVVRLSYRHTAPLETSAALRKFFELKVMEFEAYRSRPSMDETAWELYTQIGSMRNDYEEGETVERVRTWFECPNKEVETRIQTWDSNWIGQMLVVIFPCVIFGNFILSIYTGGGRNDRNDANENARMNMGHRRRVIWF